MFKIRTLEGLNDTDIFEMFARFPEYM